MGRGSGIASDRQAEPPGLLRKGIGEKQKEGNGMEVKMAVADCAGASLPALTGWHPDPKLGSSPAVRENSQDFLLPSCLLVFSLLFFPVYYTQDWETRICLGYRTVVWKCVFTEDSPAMVFFPFVSSHHLTMFELH